MFGLGGISIASILAAINVGAHSVDSGKPNLWAATLFIVALSLFIKTQNFSLLTTTAEIEAIIRRLRVRLLDQVRRSELLALDTDRSGGNCRRHYQGDCEPHTRSAFPWFESY